MMLVRIVILAGFALAESGCHLLYSGASPATKDAGEEPADAAIRTVTFHHKQRIVEVINGVPDPAIVEPFDGDVDVSVAINDGELSPLTPSASGEYKFDMPNNARYAIRVHYNNTAEFAELFDRELQGDSPTPQLVVDAVTRKGRLAFAGELKMEFVLGMPPVVSVVSLGIQAQTPRRVPDVFDWGELDQGGKKRFLNTSDRDQLFVLGWDDGNPKRVKSIHPQTYVSGSPKTLQVISNAPPITARSISTTFPVDAAEAVTGSNLNYNLFVSHYPALAELGPVFGIQVFQQDNVAQGINETKVQYQFPDVFQSFSQAWTLQTERTKQFICVGQPCKSVIRDQAAYIGSLNNPTVASADLRGFPSDISLNNSPLTTFVGLAAPGPSIPLTFDSGATQGLDHFVAQVIDASAGINQAKPRIVSSYHSTTPAFQIRISDFEPSVVYVIRVIARKGQDPEHTLDIFKRTLPFNTFTTWSGPFTFTRSN